MTPDHSRYLEWNLEWSGVSLQKTSAATYMATVSPPMGELLCLMSQTRCVWWCVCMHFMIIKVPHCARVCMHIKNFIFLLPPIWNLHNSKDNTIWYHHQIFVALHLHQSLMCTLVSFYYLLFILPAGWPIILLKQYAPAVYASQKRLLPVFLVNLYLTQTLIRIDVSASDFLAMLWVR